MNTYRDPETIIAAWLDVGPAALPHETHQAIVAGVRTMPRRRSGFDWPFRGARVKQPTVDLRRLSVALGTAAVVVVATALVLNIILYEQTGVGGPQATPTSTARRTAASTPAPSTSPRPSGDLGTLEPVPGRVFCGGVESGNVIACSADGTRLLIQEGNESLLIRDADGSEIAVADLSEVNDLGSARPSGATISPDGSRVVFAGLTRTSKEGHTSCHDGALLAVDAGGGPAEVLWESQLNRIVMYPVFSPDGTQLAFTDGNCDSDHSVWLMNADGSNAHQIVSSEAGGFGAGYVRGLAWSPAGDRIALNYQTVADDGAKSGTYTFAADGSDFTYAPALDFCWPGWRC